MNILESIVQYDIAHESTEGAYNTLSMLPSRQTAIARILGSCTHNLLKMST
jgi:hypothetical protein